MHNQLPLRGIIPPMVTPLLDADQLDIEGSVSLVEHLLQGGVHGIFALGTTGEGTSLTARLRYQLVELVAEAIQGRVPLLVGITDTSMVNAIALAEHAYGAGAAAVVTAAPYYLPLTQDDLLRYTRELATRLPLPLMLYNMPSCTKTAYSLETVEQLSGHPNIIGLKDTSGDLDYYAGAAELAKSRGDFTLLIGPEEKLARSLELGGHGGVCGGANFFPKLYVDLYEAGVRGDRQRANELQAFVQQVSDSLYNITDSGAKVLQGVKAALAELGICSGVVAPPFRTYGDEERQIVRAALDKLVPEFESTCNSAPPQSKTNA